MSSSSAVRTILSKCPRISTLPQTKDPLLGTELLLLASTRKILQASYSEQLTSKKYDVVTTSLDTSISFLHSQNLFEDMSRDNDVSYYKVGRGKKGVDEESGEEYSFETQKLGYRHCIPRTLVSEGEKMMFGGMLLQIALGELNNAKEALAGGSDSASPLPLLGASVFMDRTAEAGCRKTALSTSGLECLENQLLKVVEADSPMPDMFCIEGCESAERLEQLKELIKKNEKRMVRLSVPTTTGHYKEDDFETELGFDIPTVVIRDGQIDEII